MGDLILGILLQYMVCASLPVFTGGKELKPPYEISHKLMRTLWVHTGAMGCTVLDTVFRIYTYIIYACMGGVV